jgi:hypothetical protein
MLSKNELLKTGYYFGHVSEFITDMTEYQQVVNSIVELSQTKDKFNCTYGVNDVAPINGVDVPKLKRGPLKEADVPFVDEYVKKYNAGVIQKYWVLDPMGNHDFKQKQYFEKEIDKFVTEIYPELKDNIFHFNCFTLHEKTNFTGFHQDGPDNGRKCVILVYFGDGDTYNNSGGQLAVKENNLYDEILPINGKFCILDCSENDLTHAVLEVKDDFKRLAYVDFIYNKQIRENNIK